MQKAIVHDPLEWIMLLVCC